MKLGIGDALGLSAAARDEEVVETHSETPSIISRAVDLIKNFLCSDKENKDS